MDDPFFVRNVVYGIEDSLISTTGLVVGISLAGVAHADVVKSGIILLLVESLSMAFGSFISEDSFMTESQLNPTWDTVIKYAIVMLGSYAAAGLIPLLPFLVNIEPAWMCSTGLSIATLALLMFGYQHKATKHSTKQKLAKTFVLTIVASFILGLSIVTGRAMHA